jgi:hypothetical protein
VRLEVKMKINAGKILIIHKQGFFADTIIIFIIIILIIQFNSIQFNSILVY